MKTERRGDEVELDQIVTVLSGSLARANGRISESARKGKEGLAYVATEVSISFPAEFSLSQGKPIVRFADIKKAILSDKDGGEDMKSEGRSLATITINLRPVPV